MKNDAVGSGPLGIAVERVGTATVLSVRGDLDLRTTPDLIVSIDAAVAEATPSALIIDLTKVAFLAAVSMTVLIDAHRRVQGVSKFAVVANGPTTSRPLILMGLNETFALHADLADALTSLTP
ncbi:STAS domain-containing protein [Rhodococcus sp. NPDC006774]|uniref:STAS domain-containing protein n=1 Tax=Rhodococcus sp. NPDC006774 TaxID=3157186 RepID=UPI0033C70CD2